MRKPYSPKKLNPRQQTLHEDFFPEAADIRNASKPRPLDNLAPDLRDEVERLDVEVSLPTIKNP